MMKFLKFAFTTYLIAAIVYYVFPYIFAGFFAALVEFGKAAYGV